MILGYEEGGGGGSETVENDLFGSFLGDCTSNTHPPLTRCQCWRVIWGGVGQVHEASLGVYNDCNDDNNNSDDDEVIVCLLPLTKYSWGVGG